METSQINKHENISKLLDSLLDAYDNNLRPDFGGPPTAVDIDINVRSMGPVSEIDMTYSMDCYFRQTWIDRRLAFQGSLDSMTLSINMLQRIWKPDTYFFNGKFSYVHVITVPNKFVRLEKDGRVLYSQRLTVKASCLMNLANFPMDHQQCPLQVGIGYSQENVIYRWNSQRSVIIASDMKMSQFDLVKFPSGNATKIMNNGEYSTLLVIFHLQRHMGYFIIQVYAPCTLLVVLSWVAFWINREATADRIALGVTTILTMTFLGMESRSALPKVSYSTALDFFVVISFLFIFATIIQFAFVHYFTKVGSGELYLLPTTPVDFPPAPPDDDEKPDESEVSRVFTLSKRISSIRSKMYRPVTQHREQMNSVSQIDRVSRVIFPLTFLLINLCYWYLYL
uniref:Neurotransmitter-gated ion-channel ligand-binding domain-containing protein n=1 Tax=Strigamia maritima TaxID=126957 RepID=T1IP38_STRMM